jgi:hypothetical protein
MKATLYSAMAVFLLMISASAQSTETARPHNAHEASQASARETTTSPESNDVEQTRADLDRLKVVLNQMRTNLAFVQTSQTPLKHQFELETDAWQVIVEQMDRRLKEMEERRTPGSAR